MEKQGLMLFRINVGGERIMNAGLFPVCTQLNPGASRIQEHNNNKNNNDNYNHNKVNDH